MREKDVTAITRRHIMGISEITAVAAAAILVMTDQVTVTHWSDTASPVLIIDININKKAQLSLTNRRESLPKLLQFGVPTTLSLTILAYLHAFNCYCVRNPRNPEKFTENSNLWSSRSSKVTDLGVDRKPICDLLLVINSNYSRICYRFRDIHG